MEFKKQSETTEKKAEKNKKNKKGKENLLGKVYHRHACSAFLPSQ